MRAREIHLAAERLLGEPLLRKSVNGTLSNYAHGHAPRFDRMRRGVYQLAEQTKLDRPLTPDT
jgi:hypothetical protein